MRVDRPDADLRTLALFVLSPSNDGYVIVTRMSVVQVPVRVASTTTDGWRDLVVGVGGGGPEAGFARLRYDGSGYPTNPTVPPAEPVADVEGTDLLIGDFESFTEGTALSSAGG